MTLSSAGSQSPSFTNEIFEFDLIDLGAIILVGIMIFLFNALGIISPLENNLERVGNSIKLSLTTTVTQVNQLATISNLPEVYEENQLLRERIIELESELSELEVARSENRDLLAQLEAEGAFARDYDTIPALVVNNTRLNQGKLVLNKGEQEGVQEGDIVVVEELMVGIITETSQFSATMTLLGTESTQIPVKTVDSEIGILTNNESGELIVSQILQSQEVQQGDRVYTAGLDGRVPPEIYIGRIDSISEDDRASTKTALIDRPLNPQTLNRVFILSIND
jgi:rod shape-determining protein MreC